MSKFEELNLKGVRTYPIESRKNKVEVSNFAQTCDPAANISYFLDTLPRILAGEAFRQVVEAVVEAKERGKPVVVMMGAHVIKCGLSPILIDLMIRGVVSAVAMNGGASIHDFEVAMWGATSEDVAAGVKDGSFGMAEQTGRLINEAITEGVKRGLGYGEALGRRLGELEAPFDHLSLLAQGYRLEIPVTVHIALGTDIVHQHPQANGAAIGEASYRDFRIFARVISNLGDGGVVLNLGSAVILPEVFLKAVTVARNLGYPVRDFTTANFDMIQHYRPNQNVVRRPTLAGGQGYSLTGHHELMIPLLAVAVKERLKRREIPC